MPDHDRNELITPRVAEDDLPCEHAQEVAREERRDDEQQQDVLALPHAHRQEVPGRVGEQDHDHRDRERHADRLPEQAHVDRAAASNRCQLAEREHAGVGREQLDGAHAVRRHEQRPGARRTAAARRSGRREQTGRAATVTGDASSRSAVAASSVATILAPRYRRRGGRVRTPAPRSSTAGTRCAAGCAAPDASAARRARWDRPGRAP